MLRQKILLTLLTSATAAFAAIGVEFLYDIAIARTPQVFAPATTVLIALLVSVPVCAILVGQRLDAARAGAALAASRADKARARIEAQRAQARTDAALAGLAESEARYRALAEQTTDIILRFDRGGIVEYASPAIRQLGYQPEAVIGRHVSGFVHPDDLASTTRNRIAALDGRPFDPDSRHEFRALKADGGWIWMQGNPSPAYDARGAIVGAVTVLRDVSAWRALEDELRERRGEAQTALERLRDSEVRFQKLAEGARDLILQFDVKGAVVFASPSIHSILGYPPEALLGQYAGRFLVPEDAPLMAERARRLYADPDDPNWRVTPVWRSRHADGHIVLLEGSPSPIVGEDGKVVGIVSILRDVTDRSALEEELRRKQAEAEAAAADLARTNWALSAYAKALSAISHFDTLDSVAKAICSAIVEQDEYILAAVGEAQAGPGLPIRFIAGDGPAAGYIDDLGLSWSAELEAGAGATGRAVREFRPIVVADFLEDETLGPWRERAAQFGVRSSVMAPFRSAENRIGILSVYGRQPNAFGPRELELFFNLGRELSLAVSMSEARERVEALEAARRSAEQTARSAQLDLVRAGRILSVAEVTTSIAHEVNQPIAAILANAETALNWIGKPVPNLDNAKAAMGRVIRDAERAGDTVKRVRRMISKEPPQLSLCILNQVVEETLGVMEHEIRMSGASLHPELARHSPLVQVDKVQIEQVLVNLISNSLEAMRGSDGARVLTVRTGLADDSTAVVAVEDTGAGFEDAIEERMFDHFFTTKEGGVGLGLALCRAIVQGHGGRIWAEPRAGGGAVLQFTLPLVSACWGSIG